MTIYGFILGLAFTVSFYAFEQILTHEKKIRIHDRIWSIGILLVFGLGFIGSRLYHVFTDWHLYQNQPIWTIFASWHGGLGIYGGILGGILGLLLWKLRFLQQISILSLLDTAAIVTPLGQAIGRLGNYVNQELFGPPTNQLWGLFISEANRPDQWKNYSFFHPLFLYESIANIILFVALWQLWYWQHHQKSNKHSLFPIGSGIYLSLFLFVSGTIRFSLDWLRWDLTATALALTTSQIFAVLSVLLGLWFLLRWSRILKEALISLSVILFVFLCFPSKSHAQISQHDFDLTIQPSVVELTVQPGRRLTQAFEFGNSGTKDLEVTLQLQDFGSDQKSGVPVPLGPSNFPYANLNNANIQLNEPFLLKADSSQQIVFALDIPPDAQEKDWYLLLVADTKTLADPTNIGSNAAATGAIAANILVRISHTETKPTTWTATLQGVPAIMDSLQNITIRPFLTNTSRSMATADVSVLILNWNDQIVYEETALPDRVLANATREVFAGKPRKDDPRSADPVPFTFNPLFAVGPYRVHVTVRGSETGPIIIEETLWAFPFSLVLIGVITVGLLFSIKPLRAYWHRHKLVDSHL